MALKKNQMALRVDGYGVSADEMDLVRQYIVMNPSVSGTFVGTAAAGTATQERSAVILGHMLDYPRTLLGAVAGSADIGGDWVVNGKNQFGDSITETITIGTTTNGGTVAGSKIFAQVDSATFTFTADSVGSGTPTLGVAIGTAANLEAHFGLPDKIGAVSDVKAILWNDAGTMKSVNSGTVTSAYVDVDNHSFNIGQVVAAADSFVVRYRSTFAAEEEVQKL